jgi:protein gp37
MSKIEWTNRTWNPVTGCNKVSQGCKNCYAERMAHRLKAMGQYRYKNGFKVTEHPDILEAPLYWKKPCMIFVNSMSDLFHEDVSDEFIIEVFLIMSKAKQHTFQILTKRPERMKLFFEDCMSMPPIFPLPNVWLGTSIEMPIHSDRVEHLRQTPAAVRFLSIEPMLTSFKGAPSVINDMDWVICGGESGPDARPMHPDWPIELRDQCRAAGVPFFFKQWGEWVGSDYEEETCVDTYGVMKAENNIDYTCPINGKYADRPGRFRIKQHIWPDGKRS